MNKEVNKAEATIKEARVTILGIQNEIEKATIDIDTEYTKAVLYPNTEFSSQLGKHLMELHNIKSKEKRQGIYHN